MWDITPNGFFSAVAHVDDPDLLVVRSRVLADSEALRDFVNDRRAADPDAGDVKVEAYRGSDYPWRVICTRDEWKAWLVKEVDLINYTNFKNEVTKRQGQARHDVYSGVWGVLLRLEKLPGALKDHAKVAVEHPRWKKGGGTSWSSYGGTGQLALPRMTDDEIAEERAREIEREKESDEHDETCDIINPQIAYVDATCTCGAWDTALDEPVEVQP